MNRKYLQTELNSSQKCTEKPNLQFETFSSPQVLISFSHNGEGFTFPHIVDVDWRLDYFIRSSNMEKVNTPVYLLSLKTKTTRELSTESSENGRNNENINFTCTQEQLQDLLFKLKDAVKQVERSSNLNM